MVRLEVLLDDMMTLRMTKPTIVLVVDVDVDNPKLAVLVVTRPIKPNPKPVPPPTVCARLVRMNAMRRNFVERNGSPPA